MSLSRLDPMVRAPESEVWADAVSALGAVRSVALACHVGPDGDALGSLLGLTLGLRALGKETVSSWGSTPFRVPRQYAFLPGLDLLSPPERFPAVPDLLVTFDTGSLDRLGTLARSAGAARCVIVVDHHASNTRYGDINLVDPDAAASVVLVDELLRQLGVALDPQIATCLYTGLTTDTGSFKFQATTPAVHTFAARLLATGIRHDAIARAVWDTNRFGYLRLLGEALGRAHLEPAHDLVWTWTTQQDFAAHDVVMEEIEGVIDVLRTTVEAEVAIVCKEADDGTFMVSMRSKGRVDVGAVCVALGGGGHRFAAGFTSSSPLDATVASLRTALDEAPRLTP